MSEQAARGATEAKTILVVDDEFDIVTVYAMLFGHHGFRVISANNGKEALAAIARQRPDLIVSDYMMPGLNGIDLCRRLKLDPAYAPIPFILLSAAFPADLGQLPCDAFLRKPVLFEQLLEKVKLLLAPA